MARSSYYYRLKYSPNDKYVKEKQEIVRVFNAHKGRYGWRRITITLRQRGYKINHKTVSNLMRSLGLKGKQRRNSQYRSYKGHIGKVARNVLARNFYATKPFEKITTDITQFTVCNKKVYFSPVLDLYNKEILSYAISYTPNLWLIRDTLSGLFARLPANARPILHSDQGWHYQHAEYRHLLAKHHITQSMSRKGNCLDNSAMESFFGRLKVEMFHGETFQSVTIFIRKLKQYIHYYNNKRISSNLNGMSPVQFRTHSLLT